MGGMYYAYRVQMKEAETTLKQCFRVAYSETIDNFVNKLPFKDGTIVDVAFISSHNRKALSDINEHNWMSVQQTATTSAKPSMRYAPRSGTPLRKQAIRYST